MVYVDRVFTCNSSLTNSLLQAKVLSYYWRGIGGLDTVGDDVHFGSTTLRVWIIARQILALVWSVGPQTVQAKYLSALLTGHT